MIRRAGGEDGKRKEDGSTPGNELAYGRHYVGPHSWPDPVLAAVSEGAWRLRSRVTGPGRKEAELVEESGIQGEWGRGGVLS